MRSMRRPSGPGVRSRCPIMSRPAASGQRRFPACTLTPLDPDRFVPGVSRMTRRLFACLLLIGASYARADDKPALETSDREKELLELTNAERARKKLPALKPNARLFRAAR